MTTSTSTIPVNVMPAATARIAELGFQAQVEQMTDYARHHLPEVVRIEVVLNERYDMGGEPGIAIEAYGSRPFDPPDQTRSKLTRWQVDTFPAADLEQLCLTYLGGAAHAG